MNNPLHTAIILSSALLLSSCDLNNPETEPNTNAPANQTPISFITSDHSAGTAPFSPTLSAINSVDNDGSIVSYKWYIDDVLNTNTTPTLMPTFSVAGTYNIRLEVTDNDGSMNATTYTITVNAAQTTNQLPTSIITSNVVSGVAPFTASFNGSNSFDNDGSIVSYKWYIDDVLNANTQATFNPTFNNAGTYIIRLDVTDDKGAMHSSNKQVSVSDNPPPSASFTTSPTSIGTAPFVVTFDASSSNDNQAVSAYSWVIEDKTYSSSIVTHTFDGAPGKYPVSLTVFDAQGLSDTFSSDITISAQTPLTQPFITASVTTGDAPLSVNLTGTTPTNGTAPYSFSWNIEGIDIPGQTIDHQFNAAGMFNALLTVTDANGAVGQSSTIITVSNPTMDNRAPTANAGMDVTIDENSTITFDGSNSNDPDGDDLTYSWIVDGYATTNPIIGVTPNFTFNGAGTHEVTLTVSDGQYSDSDTMTVTVEAATVNPPIGDAPLNRIRYNGEDLYLSGFNIAWFDFAQDFNVNGIQEAKLNEAIADLKAAGGNTLRWWIHIDGSKSPSFGSNGLVNGPGQYFLSDLERALDIAEAAGVYIVPSLWSFDMLKTNDYRVVPANDNYRILTDDTALQAYIDNALIPMVNQLNSHKALIAWELFNEPENMTEPWFSEDTTVNVNNTNGVDNLTLVDIQRTTAKMAAAIHQAAIDNGETALVTTGSKSMAKYNSDVSTDPDSKGNLYRDDRLMALANNNPLAVLDFYEPHYYNNESKGGDWSPYHHPASYWEVNKPIVIGEIYVDLGIKDNITRAYWSESLKPQYEEIEGDNMCQRLSEMGYAGAWPWQYNEQPDNMMACLSLVNPDYDANDGNARPIASFTIGATSDAPVNIMFNGSSSSDSDGTIASYQWRVDNEIVGTNPTLTHNFESADTYKIRLVVTDNLGKKSEAAVQFITLAGALPNCDLAPNGTPYCPAGYMDTDADGWFWNNALNGGAGGSCIIINGPADAAPNSCNGVPE